MKRLTEAGQMLRHWIGARERWRYDLEQLVLFQERRAQQIVQYAAAHAPFYREHWRGYDLAHWRGLPLIDKALMMANFSTFNTCGIRREAALDVALRAERERDFAPTLQGLTVGLSSGTSGHRGLFLVSAAEQAAWAGTLIARTLGAWWRRPERIAFFLRSNSNLYEQLDGRRLAFRYFDLMLPLGQAVAQLNQYQPTALVAPPSLLGMLAQARRSGQLRIQPRRVVAVAEVLEPQDAASLQDCFGVPIEQIYQCTEGLLAVSCAAGALHVQEDVVALQWQPLDAAGARVTPIITDLWRTTQPIIRYRLNDVLRLAQRPCVCGSAFRVIEQIEGRCDDVCYFIDMDGQQRPVFADVIRRMILLASDAIVDYQATQTGVGDLSVRLELINGSDFDHVAACVQATAAQTLQQYGCRIERLAIDQGLLPRPPDAKRRRVWRTVD